MAFIRYQEFAPRAMMPATRSGFFCGGFKSKSGTFLLLSKTGNKYRFGKKHIECEGKLMGFQGLLKLNFYSYFF